MSSALNHLAQLAMDQGALAEARGYQEESLAQARESGYRGLEAIALFSLGVVASRQGVYHEAVAHEQAALALARAIGNQWLAGGALIQLGLVAVTQGHEAWDDALGYLREGLHTTLAIGAAPLVLYGLYGLADLRAREGDPAAAIELLSLVVQHPANMSGVKEMAAQLLAAQQALAPPPVAAAAMARGQARDLESAVHELAGDTLAEHP
jgi:tetratricopeptide (TPR) repeat protein